MARRVVIGQVNGRPDFPALANDPTGRDGYEGVLRARESELRSLGVNHIAFPIAPSEIRREKSSRFSDQVTIGGITRTYHAGGQAPESVSFETLLPYTYSRKWSEGLQRREEFMNSYEIRRAINTLVKNGQMVLLEVMGSPSDSSQHFSGRGFIQSAQFDEPPGAMYGEYWLNCALSFVTVGGDPIDDFKPMIGEGSFAGVVNKANRDIRSPILSSYPLRTKDDVPAWTLRNLANIAVWPLVASLNNVNRDGSYKDNKKARPVELRVPDYLR